MKLQPTSVFDPNSPQARAIEHLFYFDLAIAAVIFLTVAGLVSYSALRFRARPGAGEPYQDPGNPRLETLWTVIPALILTALLALTGRTMYLVNPPVGSRAPNAVVIAHQWWWQYIYPESGIVTANELHMPAGLDFLLKIESADVIHDFWVPDLGSKKDAIPGHPNYLWIQPQRDGTYLGTCAEYCGAEHALMGIRVIVQSPAEFARWQQSQLRIPAQPAGEVAERGFRLFEDRTDRPGSDPCGGPPDAGSRGTHEHPGQPHEVDRQPPTI
jgi:cytochrome c oxidase subunit 2